jgi:hypothetical protein
MPPKYPNLPVPHRPPKINSPEELMAKFDEYRHARDEMSRHGTLRRKAPYTLVSFCHFLGVVTDTWHQWRAKREDLREAIAAIDEAIFDDKYEGAALNIFNAQIIGRDLGLADRQVVGVHRAPPPPPPPNPNEIPAEHQAIHVHPDDPDPLNLPRPLYSQAQIEAGNPFTAPK